MLYPLSYGGGSLEVYRGPLRLLLPWGHWSRPDRRGSQLASMEVAKSHLTYPDRHEGLTAAHRTGTIPDALHADREGASTCVRAWARASLTFGSRWFS